MSASILIIDIKFNSKLIDQRKLIVSIASDDAKRIVMGIAFARNRANAVAWWVKKQACQTSKRHENPRSYGLVAHESWLLCQ